MAGANACNSHGSPSLNLGIRRDSSVDLDSAALRLEIRRGIGHSERCGGCCRKWVDNRAADVVPARYNADQSRPPFWAGLRKAGSVKGQRQGRETGGESQGGTRGIAVAALGIGLSLAGLYLLRKFLSSERETPKPDDEVAAPAGEPPAAPAYGPPPGPPVGT
jgi:hypothetical protein